VGTDTKQFKEVATLKAPRRILPSQTTL